MIEIEMKWILLLIAVILFSYALISLAGAVGMVISALLFMAFALVSKGEVRIG